MLGAVAQSAGAAAGQFITMSLGWWTSDGGVDFNDPSLAAMQSYTMPVSMIMLVLGVIFTAAKVALSRKGEPLVHLAANMVWFLVIAAAGAAIFGGLQYAGDQFSVWILRESGIQLGNRFGAAAMSGAVAAFGVIIISLLCILIAFIQWVLMLFRMAALLILAGVWQMAAAASVMQGRTDSAKKVMVWSFCIVVYKPFAAIIYARGFLTIGTGASLTTMLQGVVILIMSIIALPSLIRLFSWAATPSSSGGGGGIAAAAGLAGLLMARSGGGGGGDAGGSAGGAGGTGAAGHGGGGPTGGGTAGLHAQQMESSGPGSWGARGGDQPAWTTGSGGLRPGGGGMGGGADLTGASAAGAGGGGPGGGGMGSSMAGADRPAGARGSSAGAAATGASSGGAALAGERTAAAGQQTYEWTRDATNAATDPGSQGPDQPS